VYETTFSPAVLYGCVTWSLTLKYGHRLRAFENVTEAKDGGSNRRLGKLHSEETHNLYSSSNTIGVRK
jgi:hypothetical protein